jgi:DNA repair exonuclease SbcCD nuclease subunit
MRPGRAASALLGAGDREVGGRVRFVFFADLHLDTAFAWLGDPRAARTRRAALRQTLQRIVALARDERVDAVLCGGDLYEHERVAPDTGAALKAAFASIHPIRVFLAPGNHDWYGRESLYRRVEWTDNVHVFSEPALAPVTLRDGFTLWGAGHHTPAGTRGFLDDFRVDRAGIHVALFHGSERDALREQGEAKVAHAPFTAADIPRAGLHHAFVGHYHVPRQGAFHTYPGNPDPLAFGEEGVRGAVLARVDAHGRVERETRGVGFTQAHDVAVDVTGCQTGGEVCERVAATLAARTGFARVTLRGELAAQVDLHAHDLERTAPHLDGVVVRAGDLKPGYDLDAIGHEPTIRGQFVRDVLAAADLGTDTRRRVLLAGLRALDGRDDLEVL